MTTNPKKYLLPRIAEGDQSAVTEFIDVYGGLVASLVNRYCLNSTEVDDAVQEIFVDLWKNAARFQPDKGEEVTFVAMLARRRLVDLNRRRRNRPVVDIEVDSIPTESVKPFGGDAELVEQIQHVSGILKSMPPKQGTVILMAVYGGLTHVEVARQTSLPIGTVKTWIRQGLRRIRRELEEINAPNSALNQSDPSECSRIQ